MQSVKPSEEGEILANNGFQIVYPQSRLICDVCRLHGVKSHEMHYGYS